MPVNYTDVYNNLKINEIVIENPIETQLINATKITGKTKSGLGIGVLNAITLPVYATISDTLTYKQRSIQSQYLTNYNVMVFDQALKNNSYISFINTSLQTFGNKIKPFAANVLGTEMQFSDKHQKYAFTGIGAWSNVNKVSDIKENGYFYNLAFAKKSGKFRYALEHNVESDTYNPNDMGYLQANNEKQYEAELEYNLYQPIWKLIAWTNNLSYQYTSLFTKNKYVSQEIEAETFLMFRTNLAFNFSVGGNPSISHDYYEPRVAGRFFEYNPYIYGSGFISTDYRKAIALDLGISGYLVQHSIEDGIEVSVRPRIRFSDKLLVLPALAYNNGTNEYGFADLINSDSIVFGRRTRNTLANSITFNYIINNKMNLAFKARHYWSTVTYHDFYLLNNDGLLNRFNYQTSKDLNYNNFSVDVSYNWEFAPGSFLSVVWKQSSLDLFSPYTNHGNYTYNLRSVLAYKQQNTFSFKLLFYIDYQSFKRR